MESIKTGVVLARLQPIHNGHLELIEQACDENEPRIKSVGLMLLTLIDKIKKMGIVDNGDGTVEYLGKTYDIINEKIV